MQIKAHYFIDRKYTDLYIYQAMNTVLQKNIKQQLKKQNLSVAELERRIGLRHAVVNILHGRSKNPSIHVAHAIAKELGFSIESMLTEPTNMAEALPVPVNNSNAEQPTTASHSKNSPLWDSNLGTAALTAVNEFIANNNLTPEIHLVLQCVNEVYSYAIGSVDKQIDYHFVQWICERSFKV